MPYKSFQVQTGRYTADMGGAGGGQINIITKAGTSQFHGTFYEFLRNNALDARTFNEMTGDNHLVHNQYGASLGGPLPGKKTFFFTNYEGMQMAEAMTQTETVSTALERAGDFSQSSTAIYDPSSSHRNPNYNPALPVSPANPQILRNPFPNNAIPVNELNRQSPDRIHRHYPVRFLRLYLYRIRLCEDRRTTTKF
jgi:hypothetical protein